MEIDNEINFNELQKTQGKWVNYNWLNDPFPHLDNDLQMTTDIVYAIIAGDELVEITRWSNLSLLRGQTTNNIYLDKVI